MLEECLAKILANAGLHASWLNTFSYLEYIGFRKIVKSQTSEALSLETLEHAVEEGRHALRLKRLAIKIGGPAFNSYRAETLICREAAAAYFQKLDRYCESRFLNFPEPDQRRLTYLYVTRLVELRALDIYRSYQKALDVRHLSFSLRGLLKEEERHLLSVESELKNKDPEYAQRLMEVENVEEGLYRDFMKALTVELFQSETGLHAQS